MNFAIRRLFRRPENEKRRTVFRQIAVRATVAVCGSSQNRFKINFTANCLSFKIASILFINEKIMQRFILPVLFVLLLAGFAFGQDGVPIASIAKQAPKTNDELTKDFDEFTIELPNATWRVTSKTGGGELVYGDRLNGYLQIRKVAINDGETMADVIDREQNQKLQFVPDYVNGKEENFKGNLSGKIANYEFTLSSKPMIGRAYFIQASDNKTVYILRFTGLRDKLRLLRNQTDSIARTFKLKK